MEQGGARSRPRFWRMFSEGSVSPPATANGSAQAGSDYTPAAGTLTFPALSTGPQTVNVPVLGDGSVEGDEIFTLNLSGAVGAIVSTK